MEPAKYNFAYFISLVSFLVTFTIASPYLHEMAHAGALLYEGCKYFLPSFTFSILNGLEGSIKVLCPMPVQNYPLVLAAGSLSTFVIGNILLLSAFVIFWKKDVIHLPTVFISFGFILSGLLYFFEAGEFDIFLLVQGYGIDSALLPFIGTPLLLAYLYIVYRFTDLEMGREISEENEPVPG